MDQIRIVFLGTGSGSPSPDRNVSSLAVVLDGRVLLFDCGEGTQHQLMRSSVRSGRIEAIFISHLHGDHVYGLPGLLATMSLGGRTEPLTVCGPPGLRFFIEAVSHTSHFAAAYPLHVIESPPEFSGFRVIAAKLDHTIESFGYGIVEDDVPGEFDVARATQLRIPPGPLYSRLQRGEDVEFGGRVIHSSEVVGPSRPGRRIAYCSDTRPCAAAVELARDADVVIHEATYASDMSVEAHERGHSTAKDAAHVARNAHAKRLILTHFSTRYEDVEPLIGEARHVFPEVEAASDFSEWSVARSMRIHAPS